MVSSPSEPLGRGATLVLPAVGQGNVGQLALDLLLNTCASTGARVEACGPLRSRFVLPAVGNDAFDSSGAAGQMVSSLELYRIRDKGLVVLQVRAPIVDGARAELAQELARWAAEQGFARLLLLGGADSSTGLEDCEVMTSELRFCSADAPWRLQLAATGIRELAQPALPSVGRAGLLRPLLAACAAADVPAAALVLFCKEGNNVPEACQMAAAANHVLALMAPPPAAWKPPRAWSAMEGGRIDDAMLY